MSTRVGSLSFYISSQNTLETHYPDRVSDTNDSLGALTHKQVHSSQNTKQVRNQLPHHEGPYVAGKLSPEERNAALLAWLEGMSGLFGDGDTTAENPAILDDTPGVFESLGVSIGAHLNNETFIISDAVQEHLESSIHSRDAHNTDTAITVGDNENPTEALTHTFNPEADRVSPVPSSSLWRRKVHADVGPGSLTSCITASS